MYVLPPREADLTYCIVYSSINRSPFINGGIYLFKDKMLHITTVGTVYMTLNEIWTIRWMASLLKETHTSIL